MSENYTPNSLTGTSILAEFTYLRDQIGQWAKKNFDVHLPELGIAEEIGELTHAVLKREQKIRGEAAGKTLFEIRDSLADAAIYMLHLAYLRNITPGMAGPLVPYKNELAILGALHRTAGNLILNLHLFETSEAMLATEWRYLFSLLSDFASMYQLNLFTLTRDVWASVSKRDWRKYPHDGLTK